MTSVLSRFPNLFLIYSNLIPAYTQHPNSHNILVADKVSYWIFSLLYKYSFIYFENTLQWFSLSYTKIISPSGVMI